MVDFQQKAQRLRVSASILSEEYERMSHTNMSIVTTSENLRKTESKYENYKGQISKASRLVSDIKEK
jgi:hypothetical protein